MPSFDTNVVRVDLNVTELDWTLPKLRSEAGRYLDSNQLDQLDELIGDLDDQFTEYLGDHRDCSFDDYDWNGSDEITFTCESSSDAERLQDTIADMFPLDGLDPDELQKLGCFGDIRLWVDEVEGRIFIEETNSERSVEFVVELSLEEFEGNDDDDDDEESEEVENDFTLTIGSTVAEKPATSKESYSSYGEYIRNTNEYATAVQFGEWLANKLGVEFENTYA